MSRLTEELDILDSMKKEIKKASPVQRRVIKPCPFCGGSDTEIIEINDYTYVACDCGAHGEEFHWRQKNAKEEAVKSWNTRAI